jgi:HSP20 family molecular chaperone IbpA
MAHQLNETNSRNAGVNGGGGAVPYSPLREMLGYDPFRRFAPNFDPQIDVVRNENGFDVDVPVAGFTAAQIEVVFKEDVLTIKGKNERRSFTRALHVPDDMDPASIEASVENGLLTLHFRRHPDAEPRRIEVKSGG